MDKARQRRLLVWVAAAALLFSVFMGMAGTASAAGGGTVQADGLTWCRTCS